MKITSGGFRKLEDGDLDTRARLTVYLIGQNIPKYWSFHCAYCGTKICELSGEIVQIRDVDDINLHKDPQFNARCFGRNCRMWYEFVIYR